MSFFFIIIITLQFQIFLKLQKLNKTVRYVAKKVSKTLEDEIK